MATSCPPRASSRESSTTCFWAPWKPRSLMTNNTRMRRTLLQLVARARHPALAPELERDEVPEPLHVEPVVAGPAVAEVGDRPRDHVRVEDAGLADALRGEVLVHQGRQLPAQPARERHAEALLRALEQLARHVLVEDLAQQVLGSQLAAAHGKRQAHGELHQAMVEERLAALEAGGHRRAVD